MIGNSSVLAAVLTVVSVMSLSLLSVLCLRCKKKSKIIHEEHQIYNPQTFQRGGSVFTVTQSKTVTRANQITSTTLETEDEFEDFSTAADEQSDYQNIPHAKPESEEHTYVAPLAITLYENEQKERITDADPGVYANIDTSLSSKDDEDDYENAEYLDQVVQEQRDSAHYDHSHTLLYSYAETPVRFSEPGASRPPSTLDEPDYVNEND
ncbi:LAT2 domain-containing protein [Anoplopoma fimbria]|uniref:LAT2 domain-containing protein n=1 Tax=Anoplopoma fimbria TaxID=229290 RepID=UPI0023ED4773|nr:LAT2 domain-containing protein [Anoplopoma fimbria]XP_054482236.1 LAT2 domain-containing protein [Anoplopoma fimbria]XP_054482237.1 LAT2 domain-containing protein [Anoplopoma fimbria]